MGWSRGKNGSRNTRDESRCPENGGEKEARKIEIAMGDCIKSDLEKWEKNGKMIDRRVGDCCQKT